MIVWNGRLAGAERFKQAIDERHRVVILVDYGEIGCVAVIDDNARLGGFDYPIGMDERPTARRVIFREQLRNRNFRKSGIGDVLVAVGERELRSLD